MTEYIHLVIEVLSDDPVTLSERELKNLKKVLTERVKIWAAGNGVVKQTSVFGIYRCATQPPIGFSQAHLHSTLLKSESLFKGHNTSRNRGVILNKGATIDQVHHPLLTKKKP